MKKSLLVLIVAFAGCVSSQDVIDSNTASMIPSKAEQVILFTSLSSDSLFEATRTQLIRDGHRVESDRDQLTISTEGLDIGQSTFARYTLYIDGSNLYGRADWMPGTAANAIASSMAGITFDSKWEKATWDTGRPKRAFASLVSFLNSMPNEKIEFE